MSAEQLKQLEQELLRGAYAQGYAEDYWTLDRIARLIWDKFQVRYHPVSVWYIMKRTGWSNQRPQRQALQRDDETIAHWKRYTWPGIKKWRELKATLVFEDESGFSLVSPLKRTWSPCGHMPVVRTSLNHHQRLNMLGAILVPYHRKKCLQLSIRSFTRTLTGVQVVAFLKQLLRAVRGEIILVWDNHPIHQRKLVEEFLEKKPRLHVYWFPICAPELNPAKFIWTQLKEHTASTAPHNLFELRPNVLSDIAKIRRSQSRLQACLSASDLSWK